MRFHRLIAVAWFVVAGLVPRDPVFGADGSLRKIRAAITSISGSMMPPWAAHEAGIFKKYGLQVEVIATPSGVQGTNALIAGEVSFVQIAGGTTAGAVVGGADLKIIATMVNTLVLNLVTRPEIEKAEQLRGKSIGISRFGTSLHTGARLAAKHFGLEPAKDVHIARSAPEIGLSAHCRAIVYKPPSSAIPQPPER